MRSTIGINARLPSCFLFPVYYLFMFIADRNYCTDVNPLEKDVRGRALDESDPAAAFFLVAKGNCLDDETAARFGLGVAVKRGKRAGGRK